MSTKIYDINDYTEEDLYEILNLDNPTDRELEAKILSTIKKYENMNTESSENLVDFFEKIYSHFFNDDEDDDEEDDEEDEINYDLETREEEEELKRLLREKSQENRLESIKEATGNFELTQGSENNVINDGKKGEMTKKGKNKEDYLTEEEIQMLEDIKSNPEHYNPTKRKIKSSTKMVDIDNSSRIVQNRTVGYTKPLEYVSGKLNPILRQTIKRIISIDSQYRTDKRTITTEFTCNLSEPLRDVVSLKLYSMQVPYTWYTISKNYGSNFIYIKGNTPGIDNYLHDVKYEIAAGNYSPTELDITIDESIETQKSVYTDVSFGTTNIFYNKYTSLCDLTVDLNKVYNENSYQVEFQNWSSPYRLDSERNNDIAAYLGFEQATNDINTLTSEPRDTTTASEETDQIYYVDSSVDNSNNYFKIKKYHNATNTTEITNATNIDDEIMITMSLIDASYSRTEIISDLNTQIKANSLLISDKSGIQRLSIDSNNKIVDDYMTDASYNAIKYTQLQIKPDRYYTFFHEYDKTYVEFPDDTRIWVGENSCCMFDVSQNYINTVVGKRPIVKQTDKYYVHTSPYIECKCLIDHFDLSINDFSFNIPNSYTSKGLTILEDITQGGYTLNEYVRKINESIIDISDPLLTHQLIDISAAPITEIYSGTNIPTGSAAYITTDPVTKDISFNLFLNFEKRFSEQHYYVDLSGGIFTDTFQKSYTDGSVTTDIYNGSGNKTLQDLTSTIRNVADITSGQDYRINENQKIFTIYPIDNNNTIGNENDVSYNLFMDTTNTNYDLNTFTDGGTSSNQFVKYIDPINDALNNFVDPMSGLHIFSGTNLSYNTNPDNNYDISLNIKMKKVLNARGYSIQFVDNITTTNGTTTNIDSDTLNVLSETETWKNYLKLDETKMINEAYDLSFGDLTTETTQSNSENPPVVISTVDSNRDVTIHSKEKLDDANTITLQNNINNLITIKGYENGVLTTDGENDIVLRLAEKTYNKAQLLDEIQKKIDTFSSPTVELYGTVNILKRNFINLEKDNQIEERDITKFDLTVTRKYTAKDYKVVFYDETSFVTCYVGVQSVRNTTWDSTLGWVLGYRLYTVYDLKSVGTATATNAIIIQGDTGVSTNLYNYFLLCLDDYNQNHLNDGLITIANKDTTIPLPSYANRTEFQCDPTTGEKIYNINTGLTEKQIYSVTSIANAGLNETSIGSSISVKSYGSGPYVKDVFGLIPIKVSGLKSGDSYVEFGGTLQNQERSYFGPVNIERLTIRLMTDRGDVVDLNNANWSFSLICEQLNKTTSENE
tara:strand:+ start:3692 stop:7567 length:3876 start_codon:yes stop_codon:yes gene_type:complete